MSNDRDGRDPGVYQGVVPSERPKNIIANRAPTANDRRYKIGTLWVNKSANASYQLTSVVAATANWELLGSATGAIATLTGTTGGALSPTGGNINILGTAADGLSFAGSGSTLTGAIAQATETQRGTLETATDAEALAFAATDKALVPSNLAALTATTAQAGILETATDAEAQAKTAVDKIITPSNLAAVGFIQTAEVSLTAAQIKALATTPIELVAAPGASKAIKFMGAGLKLVAGTEVLAEAGDNLGIKYTDAAGVQVSQTIECTGFIDQAADTYTNSEPAIDAIVAAASAENQALVLDNLGVNFTGNASNDATLEISVAYRVVEI